MPARACRQDTRTTPHRIVTFAENLTLARSPVLVLGYPLVLDCSGRSLIADCPMPTSSDSATATIASGPAAPTSPPNRYRDATLGVFALLLAWRTVNALTQRTFFQPDEYFQALEPAWQLAFGESSNAWITWVNALPGCHYLSIDGCLSHDARRSGERSCGRPCIRDYLQSFTESQPIWQTSVA
jgi:hypothetical protein